MTTGHRDLVIETLADAEAELLESVGDVMIARDACRALAQQAIHRLHAMTIECARGRAAYGRLLDEYRRLRAQTTRAAAA